MSIKSARIPRQALYGSSLAQFTNLTEAVSQLSPLQSYPAAVEIYAQGSTATDVYFIEDGLVKMTSHGYNGQQVITSLRSSGCFLGASCVILQKPFAVNAVTLTKCGLRRIPAPLFIDVLKSDALLSWQFQKILCHEIYEQVNHTAELGYLSARSRLERLLWNSIHSLQPCPPRTNVRVHLPLKNKELADLIAVTPEHLSRMLRKMQEEGVVKTERGWIVVTDLHRLRPPHASVGIQER